MKNLNQKISKVLEENDFVVLSIEKQNGEHVAEMEWYSPAGEDVLVTVWFDGTDGGFVKAFSDYADGFDTDEHAEMWINSRGKNGVPSTIRELIEDADEIRHHLEVTAKRIELLCI